MSFQVIGIGEVLWDLLPSGPQLGGAPANFAYHAHSLGARSRIVTRIGDDELGRNILARFKQVGLDDSDVQTDREFPTGRVSVTLDDSGVPQYVIHENAAWDQLAVTESALKSVGAADAVCFGSLAQRHPVARASVQQLVAATPIGALRVFDINLRQHYHSREIIEASLRLATVLKLNDSELPVLSAMFGLTGAQREQLSALARSFDLETVALTRGAQGSLLYHRGCHSEQLPCPVKVVDTVGAGDAFTAALVMGLLHGRNLNEIHALAEAIAGHVCSCAGAMPSMPEDFRRSLCSTHRVH